MPKKPKKMKTGNQSPEPQKRKGGAGGKLFRSEVVTVRLDPKLRFAAELASRKHRRTLSSFVEWAVGEALDSVVLDSESQVTVRQALKEVWDPDEADRFVKLATKYPELLNHEEELLWKFIVNFQTLWMLQFQIDKGLDIEKNPDEISLAVLREEFTSFKFAASASKATFDEQVFVSMIFNTKDRIEGNS